MPFGLIGASNPVQDARHCQTSLRDWPGPWLRAGSLRRAAAALCSGRSRSGCLPWAQTPQQARAGPLWRSVRSSGPAMRQRVRRMQTQATIGAGLIRIGFRAPARSQSADPQSLLTNVFLPSITSTAPRRQRQGRARSRCESASCSRPKPRIGTGRGIGLGRGSCSHP